MLILNIVLTTYYHLGERRWESTPLQFVHIMSTVPLFGAYTGIAWRNLPEQ